jgi:hypothetical protein
MLCRINYGNFKFFSPKIEFESIDFAVVRHFFLVNVSNIDKKYTYIEKMKYYRLAIKNSIIFGSDK